MSFSNLVIDAGRVAVLLALALAAMPLLRRASSATRRLVLASALAGAFVLPLVSALAPSLHVEAHVVVPPAFRAVIVSDPVADVESAAPSVEASDVPVPARHGRPWTFTLAKGLVVVWLAGAAAVLARLLVGLARSHAIVRRAASASSWSEAIARAETRTGLRAEVRTTRELDAPAVTGVFAPVVLVPDLADSWSEARRDAVLLHELAHVAQRDCLAQVVAQLACALHWFDPLVWIAARRLRTERELAADDAVVTGGTRPTSYAEDLLAIAGIDGTSRRAPAGALGMAERSELVTRVAAIVACERARGPLGKGATFVLVGGVALVVLGVACSSPSATARAPEAQSATLPPSAPAADSTIDPRLQKIADAEVERVSREWDAAAATVLVLNASTGEIVANAGRVHGAPADVASSHAYLTGSTMKAVTLSAALDEGVLRPTEQIDCEHGHLTYGGKEMTDAHENGVLAVRDVFAVSSNVGFTKIFDRVGGVRLEKWLRAFHFGVAPGVEGATAGEMPRGIADRSYEGAVAAIGEWVTASPLQVAAAYAAIENGGEYIAPTLVRRHGDAPRERVMKPETARTMVDMLDAVVTSNVGTGELARIPGKRAVGKTGTAGWELPGGKEGVYSSFVGFVAGDPSHLVILVGVEQPRDGEGGGKVAAPVFARVATQALGG